MSRHDPARWLEAEPDEDLRAELAALLADPSPAARGELADRFDGELSFGTAGLRAAVGAGPRRMNRLVVRRAAAAVVDHLLATVPDAARRGLVIGGDARDRSDLFVADTARVAAARGMRARVLPRWCPTPLGAFAITELGAAGGVMVTASHNPVGDNGYKVYLDSGAQILEPVDAEIAAAMARLDPLEVGLADVDDPLVEHLDGSVEAAYLDHVARIRVRPEVAGVRVAYTALHGVGGRLLEAAFAAAGLPAPVVVESQHRPDGTFPTAPRPNPEEPGVMDAVIDLARRHDLDLALAHDPDADRLGVAIPGPDGVWRRLEGDEVGWLLADHLLDATDPGPGEPENRMVVTTVVSSSMLAAMAQDHGVACVETLTGFKWIARTIQSHPQRRCVFAYEQALGYLVGDRPLDKDGITAAVVMAELAAVVAAQGGRLHDRLEDLSRRYGRHLVTHRSIPLEVSATEILERLAGDPVVPDTDCRVERCEHLEAANLVRWWLATPRGRIRIQVRPSGTEPRLKIYGEGIGVDPGAHVDAVARWITQQGPR